MDLVNAIYNIDGTRQEIYWLRVELISYDKRKSNNIKKISCKLFQVSQQNEKGCVRCSIVVTTLYPGPVV